jgi:hypothetical protein
MNRINIQFTDVASARSAFLRLKCEIIHRPLLAVCEKVYLIKNP